MSRDLIRFMQSLFPMVHGGCHGAAWQPSMDVYRDPQGWLLKFDLAGVEPQDVELLARGRCLVIRGIRRDWLAEQGCSCYRMEISYNRFERTIELPCDLKPAAITTEYRHGMLLVHIPTEREK